jgi:amidase
MPLGTVRLPTIEQLRALATDLHMTMSDAELAVHRNSLAPSIEAYNALDQMPDELPPVRYPRLPGSRPAAEANPHVPGM